MGGVLKSILYISCYKRYFYCNVGCYVCCEGDMEVVFG